MTFYQTLQQSTTSERDYLLSSPLIGAALNGTVSRGTYVAFLEQAYHHVTHTVPLLMASGSRLPTKLGWLRDAMVHYVAEENGHEEWILNDIRASGGDPESVRNGQPALATELMVSTMYDRITRINPVCMLGMVFVLEGTSVALASRAAGSLAKALRLPPEAFTYLTSHGSLDQEHIVFFERLVNRLDSVEDQRDVLHTARVVYRLYADMFRGLPVAREEIHALAS